MDVFMSLPDGATPPLRAPYLGPPANGIDGSFCASKELAFADYPQVADFAFWKPGHGLHENQQWSLDQIALLMQNWLFFGLIAKFFQQPIDTSNFVEDDEIKATTDALQFIHNQYEDEMLHQLLLRAAPWKRFGLLDEEEQRTKELLDFARAEHDLISIALDTLEVCAETDRTFAKISLSISLLIDCLADLYFVCCPSPSPNNSIWLNSYLWCHRKVNNVEISPHNLRERHVASCYGAYRPRIDVRLLQELFEERGWCPARARQVCGMSRFRVCNYLCSITRNDTFSQLDHKRCRAQAKCLAFDVDEETYQRCHASNCSTEFGCVSIRIQREDIKNIIKSGGIPLLSMQSSGDPDIKVVKYDMKEGYTAISHVWADGLGNPSENSLLTCQLLALRDSVLRARIGNKITNWTQFAAFLKSKPQARGIDRDHRILVWIDSLCIPTRGKTEGERALKQKAVNYMPAIFSCANRVLILERGLQKQSLAKLEERSRVLQLAGFVAASKWVERAWTLEESCMASLRCFELEGESVEMLSKTTLGNQYRNSKFLSEYLEGIMLQDLCRTFDFSLALRKTAIWGYEDGVYSESADAERFTNAWNDLSGRTMTRSEDGPMILADLIDMNTSGFSEGPDSDRLPMVVKSCWGFPLSLMYIANGQHNGGGSTAPGKADSWLPLHITADRLYPRPYLSPGYLRSGDGPTVLRCGGWEEDHKVHLAELSTAGIPGESPLTVTIKCPHEIHSGMPIIYIIELAARETTDSSLIRPARYDKGKLPDTMPAKPYPDRVCIVLDEHVSTSSRTGIRARGALFEVIEHEEDTAFRSGHILLRFLGAVTARTREQWAYEIMLRSSQTGIALNPDATPTSYHTCTPLHVEGKLLDPDCMTVDIETEAKQWAIGEARLSRRLGYVSSFINALLIELGWFAIALFILISLAFLVLDSDIFLIPYLILVAPPLMGTHMCRLYVSNERRWRRYMRTFEEDLDNRSTLGKIFDRVTLAMSRGVKEYKRLSMLIKQWRASLRHDPDDLIDAFEMNEDVRLLSDQGV